MKYKDSDSIKAKLKGIKKKIKKILKFLWIVTRTTRLSPFAIYKTVRYSGIKKLIQGKGIICGTNSHIKINKKGKLEIEGLLVFGRKKMFPGSNDEAKLFVGKNAMFRVDGRFDVDANCEIVVFENAELIIKGGKYGYSDANSGLRIICGQKIEIKEDVGIGRDVMIRDTNGNNHFINTMGYKTSRPIVIGERAWLCESCTIMPGVKIGMGAIVAVNSTVTKSVPDHSIVSGYPAQVVQKDVIWKM